MGKVKILKVYRESIPDHGHEISQDDNDMRYSDESLISVTEFHHDFDKPLLEVQYGRDGQIEQETAYEYDAKGFLVRELMREGDGSVVEQKSYEPDDKRRISKEFRHYADGSFDTMEFWYDENGHVVKKQLTDDNGTVESTELFIYENDKLIRETLMDEDEAVISDIQYLYDEEGLLEEMISNNHETGESLKQQFLYNDSGVREAILSYNDRGDLVERYLFTLDEKQRPTQVVEENRQKKNTISMTYDDRGNIVFQEERDLHGEMISRIERFYDANGNISGSRVHARHPNGSMISYKVRHEYEYFKD